MKKIAITISDDHAKAIERIRRRKQTPRSRVIQQAIAFYLSEHELHGTIRQYEEGYRRHPEDAAEAEAFGTATATVLAQEDWG